MNNAELHELIPLHALGALEPYQVPYIEAYLKAYPEAQASYVWYLEAVTVLARAIPLEEPPQDLKARMLDRVRLVNAARDGTTQTFTTVAPESVADVVEPSSTSPVPIIPSSQSRAKRVSRSGLHRSRFLPVALGTMAMAVIAGLVILNVQTSKRIGELEASEQNLERLLTSSQTKSAVLNTPDGKTAIGKVFVGNGGQLLISHSMLTLPSGKTWQAWYILKGETAPHSLGITNASHLMTQLPANVQVVAVSEEPAGGSLTPTTVRAVATLNL
jgi:anti-sigma-K factor RskA